jgi:hypothetical protein
MSVIATDLDGDGGIFDLDYQETPGDESTSPRGAGDTTTPLWTPTTPLITPTPLWTPTPLATPTPIR